MANQNSFFDWVGSTLSGLRFVPRDTARADDVNTALDHVSAGFTAVETKITAAIKLRDGETAPDLGSPVSRAGKVLGFNAITGAAEAVITAADIAGAQTNAGIATSAAAAAAATYDLFDDRMLGAMASNPATDNDGNALAIGALYFNTTAGEMRVYTATGWDAAYLPAGAYATLNSPAFTGTVTIPTPFTLGGVSVTATGTELNFVDGVTSPIQTQLDAKAALAGSASQSFAMLNGTVAGTLSLTGASSTLGYGTGAGGTVTQATSKSTAVTLNKPCGRITMNNEALAAGASVMFSVSNTLVATTDTVLLASPAFGLSYRLECASVASGLFYVRVTNVTGGSLSEALVINFAIIKGAAS